MADGGEFRYQDGKKIPDHFECPIDTVLVNSCRCLFPSFRRWGFTANTLTTLSFLFGLGALWAIWQHSYVWAGVLYFGGYWFDCCDGNYARSYDQVTDFGDKYDHLTDIFVHIVMICLLIFQGYYWLVILIFFLDVLAVIQLTLQECLHGQAVPTLTPLHTLIDRCGWRREQCENYISYSRYMGMGALNAVAALGLIWIGVSH